MAQYRGVVRGGRGEASRLGHKTNGLMVQGNGWDLGAEITLQWNEEDQRDELYVTVNHGSSGNGIRLSLGTFVIEDDRIVKV